MRSRIFRFGSSCSIRWRSGGTAAVSAKRGGHGFATRLAEQPDRPTLLVLHHPPIDTGLSWMTEDPDAEWVERLRVIVDGRTMWSGWSPAISTAWWSLSGRGTTLAVCPSTAPQVALDLLRSIPTRPTDDR
jgi:hypothetical protein